MCRPEHFFVASSTLCRPEAQAEGSLGTGVPREDTVGGFRPEAQAEGSPPGDAISSLGRCPERSEGCTACARQDGVGKFFEEPRV